MKIPVLSPVKDHPECYHLLKICGFIECTTKTLEKTSKRLLTSFGVVVFPSDLNAFKEKLQRC